MKFSHIGLIAVMLVVIAVALAGCSGSTPTTPSGGGNPGCRHDSGRFVIRLILRRVGLFDRRGEHVWHTELRLG